MVNGFGFPEHLQGRRELPYPFVKVSDMGAPGADVVVSTATNTVDTALLGELRARTYPAGTVIFPKVGGALLTNKRRILGVEGTFDNNIMGIVPKEVESTWLFHWTQTIDLGEIANTQTLPSIRQSEVAALPIPLPPLPEQRRIAAVLREALGGVRRAREAALARLEAARALPAAFLRSVFESEEAQSWPRVMLGAFANTSSGTTPSREVDRYYGGTVPWVKTTELRDGTIFDTDEHVTDEALRETSLRLLPEHTLLVAMYGQGQTRGRTAILGVPATLNQACFAILPEPQAFDTAFLQMWFRHNYERLREESDSRGGNQPNLNGVVLREQVVAMPPPATQTAFATDFRNQVNTASRLEAVAQDELATIDALPQSLLRQAFAGEL